MKYLLPAKEYSRFLYIISIQKRVIAISSRDNSIYVIINDLIFQ
jgi:hypothetical protein